MTDTAVKTATITMPLDAAVRGLNAVLPHISKDPQTPILQTVLLAADAFYATDRYTAARYRHGGTMSDEDGQIILPREAAVWLTKLTAADLDTDRSGLKWMSVTFTEDTITVFFDGAEDDPREGHSFTAPEAMFGYPPIHRLFDRLTPATAPVIPVINADELAAFTTSAKKLNAGKRREDLAMTFEFSDPSGGSKLPGPIHVIIGEDFDGLIQPLRRA